MTKTLAAFVLGVCAWREQNPRLTVKSGYMVTEQTQACIVSGRRRIDAITVPDSLGSDSVSSEGTFQSTRTGDPPQSTQVLKAVIPPGPRPHPPPKTCGPMTYKCSRTDLLPAPLPATPKMGNLVGAGSCFNDPDFGSKVCRISDATMFPNTTIVSGYGGDGDRNEFNTDSTKLFIESVNGSVYPMNFDPVSMTATRMYGSWGLTIAPAWSHVNKDVFYGIHASPYGTSYLKYDTSSPSIPTPTTVADFKTANCLGTNFKAAYVFQGGVSNDDTVFAAGFSNNGGQGGAGAHYVAAYKVGSGCQMLDTATGIVTGDWGTRGAVPNWTSMTDSDGILLHTVNLNKAGDYVIIYAHVPSCPTCGSNGVYFWQIGTTNVTQPSGNLGGHLTEGYSHWINANNSPIGQFQSRLFSNPGVRTAIIPLQNLPPLTAPFDLHTSWNTADPLDTNPFCLSEYHSVHPVLAVAWYDEILCVSPVNGKVWRFAHTFHTELSHRFNDLDAIGTLSQDGRFFMWSSDWMGTLGSETGASSCTVGTNCRGDVFVVELK